MARKFYAVQVGSDYSSDNGSTVKREALRKAKREARLHPDEEVRISVCTTDDDFCTAEIIVQEGRR